MTPTWTPRTPPDRLVTRPITDSPRWRGYLTSQGYGAGELPATVAGLAQDAETRVASLERAAVEAGGAELEPAQVAQARAGAVRAYLEAHPPVRVQALDPRPVAALNPQAFGARLVPVEAGPGAVQVLEDLVTGRRWWTVGEAGDLAAVPVMAGALYRLVGVGAPAARLVELEGQRRAVHPEPGAWEDLAGQVLELNRPTLVQELPADAWLGWRGGLAGMRGRSTSVPRGMVATLRLALGSTLGRAGSRKAPTWGVDVPELGELLASRPWKGAEPAELAPMAARVQRLTERQIRQAVELGHLAPPEVSRLVAVLVGRRDLVAHGVQALISGADRAG